MAEEFGLIGVSLILFLFFILLRRMCAMIETARDPFKRNVMIGVVLVLAMEIFINIGVTCGLLPTKGLSLPFISYGGSNMLAHFLLLGLFFNASRVKPGKEDENTLGL